MSTSKKSVKDSHAYELLDYVIYGDNTLQNIENPSFEHSVDLEIQRCSKAVESLSSTLKFVSPGDVCEECEPEYQDLINNAEDTNTELESHFSDIVEAYRESRKEIDNLYNIIHDLVQYAADAVGDDDVKDFEEYLIMKNLEGEK